MEGTAVVVVAALVLAYALLSRRLSESSFTPPLAFVSAGMLLGMGGLGLGLLDIDPGHEAINIVAELTLILVLFSDATRIDLSALRREAELPARLLALGLPLTMALGAGLALLCVPGVTLWEAALIGAVLAPTDAALGQAVVSSNLVPARVRQALNVESGLNDGIALPIVLVFASLAGMGATEEERTALDWLLFTGGQLVLGPLAGVLIGVVGARVSTAAREREMMSEEFEKLGALAMAVLSFELAEAIGGNGFIAAFVAGMTLGNLAKGFTRCVHAFLEAEGQLLMLIVFLLLGSVFAWPALIAATPLIFAYAVLSLTLVRVVPVSLSLVGAGLKPATHLFLGWFGPRGLATVLYGLLIVDESSAPHRHELFTVAIVTVLLSVLAHGLSATPGVKAYARALGRRGDDSPKDMPEHAEVTHHPTR